MEEIFNKVWYYQLHHFIFRPLVSVLILKVIHLFYYEKVAPYKEVSREIIFKHILIVHLVNIIEQYAVNDNIPLEYKIVIDVPLENVSNELYKIDRSENIFFRVILLSNISFLILQLYYIDNVASMLLQILNSNCIIILGLVISKYIILNTHRLNENIKNILRCLGVLIFVPIILGYILQLMHILILMVRMSFIILISGIFIYKDNPMLLRRVSPYNFYKENIITQYIYISMVNMFIICFIITLMTCI